MVEGGRKGRALAKRSCHFLCASDERRDGGRFWQVRGGACMLQASDPDGKLEGSPSGPGIPAAQRAQIKANRSRSADLGEDQTLAWQDQEGFNVAAVQSRCPPNNSQAAPPQLIHRRYKNTLF